MKVITNKGDNKLVNSDQIFSDWVVMAIGKLNFG